MGRIFDNRTKFNNIPAQSPKENWWPGQEWPRSCHWNHSKYRWFWRLFYKNIKERTNLLPGQSPWHMTSFLWKAVVLSLHDSAGHFDQSFASGYRRYLLPAEYLVSCGILRTKFWILRAGTAVPAVTFLRDIVSVFFSRLAQYNPIVHEKYCEEKKKSSMRWKEDLILFKHLRENLVYG